MAIHRGGRAKLYDWLHGVGAGFKGALQSLNVRTGEAGMAKFVPSYSQNTGGPGAWQWERAEQVRHYRHWVYTCVNFFQVKITSEPPRVAYSRPLEERKAYYRKQAEYRRMKAWGGQVLDVPPHRKFVSEMDRKAAAGGHRPGEDLEYADENHPLNELLQNPNGPDTWVSFWKKAVLYYLLNGVNYTWKVRGEGGKEIAELWTLPAHWVVPICLGGSRLIDHFEVRPVTGGTAPLTVFDVDEIIEVKDPHPLNELGAQSPLQANSEIIDQYESIQLSRYFQNKNGAQVGTVLQVKAGEQDPDDTVLKRLQARFAAKHVGEANFNMPDILPPALEIVRPPADIELAYLASTDQLRDYVIAQTYRLSKTALGITEGVPWATFVGEMRRVIQDVINPILTNFGGTFTEKLAAVDYDPDLRIFWSLKSPQDDAQRLAEWTATPGPAVAVNEYRVDVLGLEPLDDPSYDHPLQPAGLVGGNGSDEDFDGLMGQIAGRGPMQNPGGTSDISPDADFAPTGGATGGQAIASNPAAGDSTSSSRSPLLDTVGGANALASLQQRYATNELTRDMAVNNAKLIFGLSDAEAESLFPLHEEGIKDDGNGNDEPRPVARKHGPPPFPGAVFDESRHRWVSGRAGDTSGGTTGDSPHASEARTIANNLAAFGTKAVDAAKKIGTAAIGVAARIQQASLKLGITPEDILDTVEDYAKICIVKENWLTDHLGIGANSATVIGSHLAAYAVVKIKQKLRAKGVSESEDGDLPSLVASVVAELLAALGMPEELLPTAEDAAAWLESKE